MTAPVRNRREVVAQLVEDRHERAAGRHRAAVMWRDHPVRQALRAQLDLLAGETVDKIAPRVANLLADKDNIAPLIADLVARLGREPFFDPHGSLQPGW